MFSDLWILGNELLALVLEKHDKQEIDSPSPFWLRQCESGQITTRYLDHMSILQYHARTLLRRARPNKSKINP
jgi:predicted nicotinamide N-methyase